MNRNDPPPGPANSRTRTRRGEWRPPVAAATEIRFGGIGVSDGIAIGPVFGATELPAEAPRRPIAPEEAAAEVERLDQAIAQSRKQLAKLRGRLAVLPEDSQAEIAPLIDAYIHMLGASRLTRGMRQRIREQLVSAETAVLDESEALAASIAAPPEARLSHDDRASQNRRAEEVREIGRRLIRNLTHRPFRSFAALPEGAVLVCESLRPADAALLDPSRLAGVATEEGGADGHTAIMLRALGLPAVLGSPGLCQAVHPGDLAVIDGTAGTVVLNPSPAGLAEARRAVTAFARQVQRLAKLRRLPARTEDGHPIELQANLEIPAELPLIAQSGAAGIGLLRTEFLFMNRETLPDEATQAETYRTIIEAMGGDAVTIRVLDWSADKDVEALGAAGIVPDAVDLNPAFGLRGIRLLLRHPELLEIQFAAILRAANAGPVRVLLPMVTNAGEVRAAREIYERVVRRLRRRNEKLPEPLPPLGVMIETPGAALAADSLALEGDFFAIGTNDLSMYTLAVDRGESDVADLYNPLHPAVLRLIQFATEAALRVHKQASICGEMAANPRLTPLLLGLGLRSFSMSASAVPRVKRVVRDLTVDACVRFARRVMESSDLAHITDLVVEFAKQH